MERYLNSRGISLSMEVDSDYQRLVDLVVEKDLDLDFSNSSLVHAKYVIKKIIEKTQEDLIVYFSHFDSRIFNDSEIIDALKKNSKISVRFLFLNDESDRIKQFNRAVKSDKINFKFLKNKEISSPFFIVSDSRRVRACYDRSGETAKVNFNKPKIGKYLHNLFDNSWNPATSIS